MKEYTPGPSDRVPGPWCLLPPVEALIQGSSYLRAPVPGVLHLVRCQYFGVVVEELLGEGVLAVLVGVGQIRDGYEAC